VDKRFFEKRDSVFLASAGLFYLYEKYYTLSKLTFKRPRQPTDKPDEDPGDIEGNDIADALRKKNQNLALYQGFLLLTITKNLKIFYSNLDSLLLISDVD